MSNLNTVKSALDAEIQHANEGIAFYAARIAALEQIIGELDRLGGAKGGPPSTRKAGKPSGAKRGIVAASATTRSTKAKKPRQAAKASRASTLPKTGGEFWQSLLSNTPMSNQDLLQAAIARLQIQPAGADLKKLKQRLANAVTNMTKDGTMRSEGSGRERRFSSAA